MLFEFHRQQNVKKPGTVHATYDLYMQSSPFRSSPVPNVEEAVEDSPVLSITLVKEENLEGIFSIT